jgi:hypothetical protein
LQGIGAFLRGRRCLFRPVSSGFCPVYTVFGGKAVPLGHDHPLLGLLEGQPQRIGEAGLTTGLTGVNGRSCPCGAKIRRDGDQHRAVGIAVGSLSGPALPLGVCPDSLGGYAQAGGRLGVCFPSGLRGYGVGGHVRPPDQGS